MLLGAEVSTWWQAHNAWFRGTVTAMSWDGTRERWQHKVRHEDGEATLQALLAAGGGGQPAASPGAVFVLGDQPFGFTSGGRSDELINQARSSSSETSLASPRARRHCWPPPALSARQAPTHVVSGRWPATLRLTGCRRGAPVALGYDERLCCGVDGARNAWHRRIARGAL